MIHLTTVQLQTSISKDGGKEKNTMEEKKEGAADRRKYLTDIIGKEAISKIYMIQKSVRKRQLSTKMGKSHKRGIIFFFQRKTP